jgi:hypothetical protein
MDEAAIRLVIYHTCQNQLNLAPVHGRDAMICPHCHQKVLPFDSGRPDLLVMNRFGFQTVVEVKCIHEERGEKSFAFADHKENQIKWMNWWTTVTDEEKLWHYQPIGFLAIGTSVGQQIWVMEWQVWNNDIVKPATEAGKKSVGITTLTERMKPYELIKEKKDWYFQAGHPIWTVLPNVIPVNGVRETPTLGNQEE